MTIVQILDKDFHTSILQHVKSITENRKPEKPKFRRLETIISNCPSTLTLKFDFASKFGPKSIPKKKIRLASRSTSENFLCEIFFNYHQHRKS